MHKNSFARSLVLVCLALGVFAVAGCNTVKGVGRDIEATGDAIEDAAD